MKPRYGMDQYNAIFLPAINVDLHTVIEENIDTFSEKVRNAIDLEGCRTVYEGVL